MLHWIRYALFFIGVQLTLLEAGCVLITGGAGNIGSIVNKKLAHSGYTTIVLDNLSTGTKESVQESLFIEGDLSDPALLNRIFATYPIDAVIHLAGSTNVVASLADPLSYYANNVAATINLLMAMERANVKVIVFASSCAVYGTPTESVVSEESFLTPLSPYAKSKAIVETILEDLDQAQKIRFCALRYFNVIGGDSEGEIKNHKEQNRNLIEIILHSLLTPEASVRIFGTQLPTRDGTSIRDYIHVEDIADATILAMQQLLQGSSSGIYNLGNGKGWSVREVLEAAELVTGRKVRVEEAPARAGEIVSIIADPTQIEQKLDWKPAHSSLVEMVKDSWQALSHLRPAETICSSEELQQKN